MMQNLLVSSQRFSKSVFFSKFNLFFIAQSFVELLRWPDLFTTKTFALKAQISQS